MTTYGFCIVDNPCDFRDVNVHAPPDTPLANARQFRYQEFYEPHGNPLEDKCFLFNVFYPLSSEVSTAEERVFSPGLLDALALTRVITRESQNIEVTEDRTYANMRHSGSRVVLNALCQGSVELAFRIIKIKRGGYLEGRPQNDKQKNAQIYRQSEWSVYMTGLIVCEWAIARAKLHSPDVLESLLKKYIFYIPRLPVRERLEEIIRGSGSILEQRGELFLGSDVVELIPSPNMKKVVAGFIKEISSFIDEAIDPSDRGLPSDTLTYSIFLLVCAGANEAKKNAPNHPETHSEALAGLLSKRLEEYISQLMGWYPVGNLQATFGDIDEELESEIRSIYSAIREAKLKRPHPFTSLEEVIGPSNEWLSEIKLRWAVCVVQEEEVTVMKEPLEMVSGEISDGHVQMVTESYFYLPQLPAGC
ncbi:SET domain protein [Arthroderma uncinatum]|uniref:SET domain protein n=1 Tax=Arthroderma uncinatum TaxID=74035 RepID=UPI00144AF3F7|nr:SET domain protein [Arthroderma uncinatum]KAF3481363.1 SET domain protein [Arthroderma uncinatum]